ncbi:MAG: hypothetical protein ACLFP8_05660 [Alphaproteobacteria bacterium]
MSQFSHGESVGSGYSGNDLNKLRQKALSVNERKNKPGSFDYPLASAGSNPFKSSSEPPKPKAVRASSPDFFDRLQNILFGFFRGLNDDQSYEF